MRVKFKRFFFGEGFTWGAGSEGKVIAETDTHYKVKTSIFSSEWVYRSECEQIKEFTTNRK